ncbi:hypothetical protein NPIL_6511 [Nephila pilipes]|uniref:Uncharacterized protein n=1 Tax=Nephila pilipes TaxID=299642 RepID=A0A8X6QB78_NEPPI|nr:hypothetical protein NPIL_6511 [Nephila pilipes]
MPNERRKIKRSSVYDARNWIKSTENTWRAKGGKKPLTVIVKEAIEEAFRCSRPLPKLWLEHDDGPIPPQIRIGGTQSAVL